VAYNTNGGPWRLGIVTRPDRSAAFEEPSLLDALVGQQDGFSPSATSDGLSLYFESVRSGTFWYLYVAKRLTTADVFSEPDLLPGAGANAGGPYILPDQTTLYFHSNSAGNGDIYRMARVGDAFAQPVAVNAVDINTTAIESFPVVSPDELTLYFSSTRVAGKGGADMWVSSRAAKTEPFGPAQPLASLNHAGYDIPSWVSPDGCRLYYESGLNAWVDIQLYVAERH
jgi:Tol biopolymer transport system component